jgi:hypothetical protein
LKETIQIYLCQQIQLNHYQTFVSNSSRLAAIVLLDKIKFREDFIEESLRDYFIEARRRDALNYQNRGTQKAINMAHAREVLTSAINKVNLLPKGEAKYTDDDLQTSARDVGDRMKKVEDAVRDGLRLKVGDGYFPAKDWATWLDDATSAEIKEEKKEIQQALKLLSEAQEDKIIEASYINNQKKALTDLLNRLENPKDFQNVKAGELPDKFNKGNTYRVQKDTSSKAQTQTASGDVVPKNLGSTGQVEGLYQTNLPSGRENDLGKKVITDPKRGGTSYSVRRPPVQRTAPTEPFETVPAEPVSPPAGRVAGDVPSVVNPKILEAREFIRKIGEVPITSAPQVLLDIKKQLEDALRALRANPTVFDDKVLDAPIKKARDYFTKLDADMNKIPDEKEAAAQAIDSALEDTKKMEKEKREKAKEKIPLDDLRPEAKEGEEKRVKKNFNKDVLELTDANQVLKSKVELQRQEIKVLKETIEQKKFKENQAMMKGIAPVFKHLLSLEIDNVVKEDELQEQVYYTVI